MAKFERDDLAYENQLYEIESKNKERGIKIDYYKDDHRPQKYPNVNKFAGYPYVYGEWNNFRPQRMYTIEELCFIMDNDKPDILKYLKKYKLIQENIEKPEQMNEKELMRYHS